MVLLQESAGEMMNYSHQDVLYWQLYQQQMQQALQHYQSAATEGSGSGSYAAGWPTTRMAPRKLGPCLPAEVKLELENKKLWRQFNHETTEMIITKSGRRMFPAVQVSVSGLDRKAHYSVLLELVEASDRRHKYVGGPDSTAKCRSPDPRGWTSAGPAEPQPSLERRRYLHPDGPALGSHWMQHPISFSKLKLTNNAVEHHSNVLLSSMHKYVPRIWIIRCDDTTNATWDYYNNPASCFSFEETKFIAVTAYQNQNITQLKINNNPFAKGFRETGHSSTKRKRQSSPPSSTSSSSSSACSSEDPNSSNEFSDSDHESAASPAAKQARLGPPVAEQPAPKFHRPWADSKVVKPKEETTPMAPKVEQRSVYPYLTPGVIENYSLLIFQAYQQQLQQMYQPHVDER